MKAVIVTNLGTLEVKGPWEWLMHIARISARVSGDRAIVLRGWDR